MLTRQGWTVLASAAALLVAGRLFGIFELLVIGVALVALVVASLLLVRATRVRIEVTRTVEPPRVHAGEAASVQLAVANAGRRSTPVLTLRDPVGPDQTATVLVPPLPRDGRVHAGYRLPTTTRGVVDIGPLTVSANDPFGLAQVTLPAVATAELTVWPAIETVPPIPVTSGEEADSDAERGSPFSTGGGDFHAVRPYVVGDDLRRVHWASTARHDQLMVRQDQTPGQGRATLALDTRASAHTSATFEQAVSAVASVALACARRGQLVRLVTSGGFDSGMGDGTSHLAVIMEALATVQLGSTPHGRASARDSLPALVAAARRSRAGTVALFLGAADTAGGGVTLPPGAVVVRFAGGDDQPFAERWQAAIAGRRLARVGR